MNTVKTSILNNICYTELVYERINKKLHKKYSKTEIENFILKSIKNTGDANFKKKGKNYYVSNKEDKIIITINSNTYRVITV